MSKAEVVTYRPEFALDFKRLNLAWIEEHFHVEEKDLEQVNNPERCREGGGEIFFVVEGGKAVGTCAMYKQGQRTFELAKMAVQPENRGQGLGDLLMKTAEEWARSQAAEEIFILSNTVLKPAIQLYKKHGYATTRLGPHPDYERCNIEMHKVLAA